MGVATGCGCDFLILLIPTPLVYVRFYNSIPTFVHFLNVFRSLYIYCRTLSFCPKMFN